MITPTVTEIRRNGNPVGERVELARYTVPGGERVLYGQRVNGVVRFLPEEPVVLDHPSGGSEDDKCRPAAVVDGRERPDGGGGDRLNRDRDPLGPAGTTGQRGRTGERVELGRYSTSVGERILYGQRVLGVVRVTDVPLIRGGRSYLVERGLEEHGAGANAHLQAIVRDYLMQARTRNRIPVADLPLSRYAYALDRIEPRDTNPAPYDLFLEQLQYEATIRSCLGC